MRPVAEESSRSSSINDGRSGSSNHNNDDDQRPLARKGRRPKSLSERNLFRFSRDIGPMGTGGLSRKLKREKMLADLEEYNAVFSRRLSGGGWGDWGGGGERPAAGIGNVGQGRSSSSTGSRRTCSFRTVSDLDIEPAADVYPPSEVTVGDEDDFDDSSGHSGKGGGGGGGDGDGYDDVCPV